MPHLAQRAGALDAVHQMLGGQGGRDAELLAEIRQLNARMERMERYAERTSKSTELTGRVLDESARGKQPLSTGTV